MDFHLIPQAYAQEAGGSAPVVEDGAIKLGNTLTLGIGGRAVSDSYNDIGDLVGIFSNNLLIIGGFILMIMFIVAGFKFIQDTTKGKEDAKKILQTALIGFILMFSAYWIVQIIAVVTGADIRLPGVQ